MREPQFVETMGNWGSPLPHQRVAVYRNNVVSALVNALRVRFLVTEKLVGAAFFAAMARAFAEGNRPGSPVLINYGEAFPDFIAKFPPAAPIPYLSDLASLESLWWRAYHAADKAVCRVEDFAAVPASRWGDVRFPFHPSLGLMRSNFAVASIWQAHHGGLGMAAITIAKTEHVLVARPERQVRVRIISTADHDFIATLMTGASLADAVEQTAARHPDFDITAQLQGLLGLGIITGFSI